MIHRKDGPADRRDQVASALLKPLKGTSDAALIQWLTDHGGTDITSLAPGFVSAMATLSVFREAKEIAEVEIKRAKRFH